MPVDAILSSMLLEIAKQIVFPIVGFAGGFVVQWYLQERKSRDELVGALAEKRADALRQLWEITTLSDKITVLAANDPVPASLREQANADIVEWYTAEGGALYLSWPATDILFRLLDTLRAEETRRSDLERAVSALRTRLKLDCGMYTRWEARRTLRRPRPSPWLKT